MLRAAIIIVALRTFLTPTASLAQDSESTKAALAAIKDAADSICGTVREEGSQTEIDTSGKIGGALNNLIKTLIDIDASLSVTIKRTDYQGVIREQLAGVIENNTNCRRGIFDILAARMVYTTIVANRQSCPPETGLNIESSNFFHNRTGVSVPLGTRLCIIDTTMKDNETGVEVRTPGCSNSVGGNNTGSLNNNCTFNLGPPRMPNGLYQSGIQVGMVQSAKIDQSGASISIENPRIFSATIDWSAPLEFRDVLISCPVFTHNPNRQTAQLGVMFSGNMPCQIVGPRS
jgi:hypothetical protein